MGVWWNRLVLRVRVLQLGTLTMGTMVAGSDTSVTIPLGLAIPTGIHTKVAENRSKSGIFWKWKRVGKSHLANRHDSRGQYRWRAQFFCGTFPWYRTCSHGNDFFTFSRKFYLSKTRFWLYLATGWSKLTPVFTTAPDIIRSNWQRAQKRAPRSIWQNEFLVLILSE